MQSEHEGTTTGDYGYDAAHEPEGTGDGRREPEHSPVQQATETSDQGQDYSYDLAHDVPKTDAPPR